MTGAWWLTPATVKAAILLALLLLLLASQRVWPLRGEVSPAGRRCRNFALGVLGTALVAVLLPISAVAFAVLMQARGWGLLAIAPWSAVVEAAFAVVALDMAIYWQHRAFHCWPWLWRLHRVHHNDTHFEVTLGLRFHPAEILLSMLYKLGVIAVLGPSPAAVALYEILLAGFSLLTHADIAVPDAWERRLRRLVVTPDWHRVHHSVHRDETDRNYGNLLTLWDRIFDSRIEQPRDGHLAMAIGLDEFRDDTYQTLQALLLLPMATTTAPTSDES